MDVTPDPNTEVYMRLSDQKACLNSPPTLAQIIVIKTS